MPKVGHMGAYLGGAQRGYKDKGWGGNSNLPLPVPPPRASALVVLVDLAIRSAMLLPVRVDFVEVLRLLHKDEPFVRRFTQLHCRFPSALHRRATKVPQPRV